MSPARLRIAKRQVTKMPEMPKRAFALSCGTCLQPAATEDGLDDNSYRSTGENVHRMNISYLTLPVGRQWIARN